MTPRRRLHRHLYLSGAGILSVRPASGCSRPAARECVLRQHQPSPELPQARARVCRAVQMADCYAVFPLTLMVRGGATALHHPRSPFLASDDLEQA